MSNSTYKSYRGFPVNFGLLHINCSVCGKNYTDDDYAREHTNGDPSYYLEVDNSYIHFCSAICASKHLHGV